MADTSSSAAGAVRSLSAARSDLIEATSYADPTLDALSVLGADIGQPMRPPHRDVERGLDPLSATVASSGWLAWRVRLAGRWRDRVAAPVFLRRSGAPAVALPQPRETLVVTGGDRSVERLTRRVARDVDLDGVAVAEDLPSDGRWSTLVRWSLRDQRVDLAAFLVLAMVGGVAGLALPLVTAVIFQWAIPNGDFRLAVALLMAFAVVSIGAAVLTLSRGRLIVRVRDRMDVVLAHGAMARLLRLKAPFFRRYSIGDATNRVMSVSIARAQVGDAVIATVVLSFFGLTSLLYLFTAGVAVGLLSSLAVLLVLVASVLVQWRARSALAFLLERRSRTDAIVLALLTSLVSWRVAAAESRALGLWSTRQRASTLAMKKRASIVSGSVVIDVAGPTIVLAIVTALVVTMPSSNLEPGSPSAPGAFLALYAAVVQVTIAMLALASNLLTLSEYGPVLQRLEPILTSPVEGPSQGPHPGPLEGRLALNRVTFGYTDEHSPLFQDLSLDVAAGTFVACVGPSGSGKSTLLRLLLGFEEPWTGFVAYDGRDLASLDATAVRRQMGVVLQNSRPIGSTVRECIAGDRTMTDEHIWDLLERTALANDVRAMPGGLDASLGAYAASLSGGQRQRLLVASALAVDPAILLFDEATSALDNVSQSVVMRTVLALSATRVVIAHRLSTVERADRVVVVAGGRIVEEGTPEELLRAKGQFARLAARQMS